jgi:hypothetical protein
MATVGYGRFTLAHDISQSRAHAQVTAFKPVALHRAGQSNQLPWANTRPRPVFRSGPFFRTTGNAKLRLS